MYAEVQIRTQEKPQKRRVAVRIVLRQQCVKRVSFPCCLGHFLLSLAVCQACLSFPNKNAGVARPGVGLHEGVRGQAGGAGGQLARQPDLPHGEPWLGILLVCNDALMLASRWCWWATLAGQPDLSHDGWLCMLTFHVYQRLDVC